MFAVRHILFFDITSVSPCLSEEKDVLIDRLLLSSGLIKVSTYRWRTPYMNPSCLKEFPVILQVAEVNECISAYCGSIELHPSLSLAMILETESNAEIAYLKSYRLREEKSSYNWKNKPVNNFLDVPEDLTVDHKDLNPDLKTWGVTTILNPPKGGVVVENGDGTSILIELDTDGDSNTPVKFTTDKYTINVVIILLFQILN